MNKLKLDVIIGSYYERKARAVEQGNVPTTPWLKEGGWQFVSRPRPSVIIIEMTLMCRCVAVVLSSWLELCDPRFWNQERNPGGTIALTTGISPEVALSKLLEHSPDQRVT